VRCWYNYQSVNAAWGTNSLFIIQIEADLRYSHCLAVRANESCQGCFNGERDTELYTAGGKKFSRKHIYTVLNYRAEVFGV
jgi:hypothetical protein